MKLLIGTIPGKENSVITGKANFINNKLNIDGIEMDVMGGTSCMIATCVQVCSFLGVEKPSAAVAQDINLGIGTRNLFDYLADNLGEINPSLITFHYMYPILKYGDVLINGINALENRPYLIADAGGMYLFKAVGQAGAFDIFTPDFSELQFLGDELASHPMYVRKNFEGVETTMEYVSMAVDSRNTAKKTVVKGAVDEVFMNKEKVLEIESPNLREMECIGGTGDTITGMLSGLCCSGVQNPEEVALRINREIGLHLNCNPGTPIIEFVKAVPYVMEKFKHIIKI